MERLERLDLPSGGWVEFRDIEELTGRDFLDVKKVIDVENYTRTITDGQTILAQKLISRWEIPGHTPPLPIPTARGGQNSYGQLHWRDVRKIESAMTPLVVDMVFGSDDEAEKKDEPQNGQLPETV